MRRIFLASFFCMVLSMVQAQKPTPKPIAGAAITNKLSSRNDSLQYVLGSYLGQWLKANGFVVTNPSLFAKGLNDVSLNQSRLLPDSIADTYLDNYQKFTQKDRALQQEQQLFSSLKDKQGMGMFPNGVRYIVLKTGQGPRPAAKDSIIVHLVAKLPDGTAVEDTYKTGQPFQAIPDSFFPAMSDALQMMQAGAKWQLFFPAALAYGEKGTASIPPNTAIVVDLELVSIKGR